MEESLERNLIGPVPADRHSPGALELPSTPAAPLAPAQLMRDLWQKVDIAKIATFVTSLFLFVLAITLMKDGARAMTPLVRDVFSVNSTFNSLGFGWLFAYTIMSGSPVAAAALTFYDASVVDKLGAFAMITGSRLGANFIVLLIGFLYVLRGRDRATSLSMGLLSLLVTATTYLPALLLGAFFLHTGLLDGFQPRLGTLLHSLTDLIVDPVAGLATTLLPDWGVFLAGLGVILLSFSLFDRCLPTMIIKDSHLGRLSRLVYKPAVMFLLGALVTLVSMSVSLSLSILVPLSSRGFIRRENVIPYIMGANITTFVDTLLAAMLLQNSPAFTIVFVEMFSVAVISLIILVAIYRPYQRGTLRLVNWTVSSNRSLAIFMAAIFTLPIILLLV
jgi:Na+/phosphate symporter